MRILLDTHTFLWLAGSPEQLSPTALAACEDPTHQLYLNDVSILSVELHHIYTLQQLPLHHHDPFDRLLIAQAKAEQMQLVSADSQFEPYLVDVMW